MIYTLVLTHFKKKKFNRKQILPPNKQNSGKNYKFESQQNQAHFNEITCKKKHYEIFLS